jgi:hypothetical protein
VNFREGQRVRCVNFKGWMHVPSKAHRDGPGGGDVCVVAHVIFHPHRAFGGNYLVLAGHGDGWFPADQFRPLREDDVDRLAALCADPRRVRDLVEAP